MRKRYQEGNVKKQREFGSLNGGKTVNGAVGHWVLFGDDQNGSRRYCGTHQPPRADCVRRPLLFVTDSSLSVLRSKDPANSSCLGPQARRPCFERASAGGHAHRQNVKNFFESLKFCPSLNLLSSLSQLVFHVKVGSSVYR
jgi:hypothetical protein